MLFNTYTLFDFKRLIRQDKPFYAHISDTLEPESLECHLDLALKYFNKIRKEKHLDSVFENMKKILLKNSSLQAVELWKDLIVNMIYCHDLGKINPNFQSQKMNNRVWCSLESRNSKHSFFSSVLYFNHYFDKVYALNDKECERLFMVLIINSFIISRHHSHLNLFSEFLEKLESEFLENKKEEMNACIEDYGKDLAENAFIKETFETITRDWQKKEPWKCVDWYIYARFMYGLLITCDFYATSEYVNNHPVVELGILRDVSPYLDAFNQDEITQKIRTTPSDQRSKIDINTLRSMLFLETETNLLKHENDSIYFIEAPTGSGKTRTSINLALQLLKKNAHLNKITYIFPFNTLVEQTKDSLTECFKKNKKLIESITVVNGITPIVTYLDETKMSEDGEWELKDHQKINYEKSLLARQFLHYPIVLTTHVNLFNSLFGFKREDAFPLIHLANSVIILDEIQSYNNEIWKEMIIFLKEYAKLLNMKIIIMSATLPDLNQLCHEKSAVTYLINDREVYFKNPLFKDRVHLDYSLLDCKKECINEKLMEKVLEVSNQLKERPDLENKILIEFISKKSALDFFEQLCKMKKEKRIACKILLMTGDDNKAERKRIIDLVKGGRNLILVATQVIESGVDIDMDAGFKDTSILDAEEQFLGRINRSCFKKDVTAYFFDMDNPETIYKRDLRIQDEVRLTNTNQIAQNILRSKDFPLFYHKILQAVEDKAKECNDNNLEDFKNDVICRFEFKKICEKMSLIKDEREKVSLFLNHEVIDVNGNKLQGEAIWAMYKILLINNTLSYAERCVKMSEVRAQMDYFIYEIDRYRLPLGFAFNDILGDLYYLQDGEQYFEEGKFIRQRLKTDLFI
ncbi:MAG: CRISPR-associated helicase Cas3' [Eubacterium sp.]